MNRRKKYKLKNGPVIAIVIMLLLIAGVVGYMLLIPTPYKEFKEVAQETKLAGTSENIFEEGEDKAKFMHYPVFDKEQIDKKILEIVNSFPDENGISFLDYDSNEVLDRYFNVTFHYQKMDMEKKVEKEETLYLTFDKETDRQLSLHDVLRRDYEDVLRSLIKEKLQMDITDVKEFAFQVQDSSILIVVDKDKNITLPYDTYANIMNIPGKSIADAYLEVKRTMNPDPNKPMIAFTFDDGPSIHTEDMMKIFKDNNATASFFMQGKNVVNFPEVVKDMYEQGFEVANHSWNHTSIKTNDREVIKTQVFDTQDAIYKITGHDPHYMRPPYGEYNDVSIEAVGSYIDLMLWNVDTLDWKSRDSEKVLASIRAGARDGAIILLHDLYPSSVDAIRTAVPELIAQGYQLVTISDLMKYKSDKT